MDLFYHNNIIIVSIENLRLCNLRYMLKAQMIFFKKYSIWLRFYDAIRLWAKLDSMPLPQVFSVMHFMGRLWLVVRDTCRLLNVAFRTKGLSL